MPSNSNSAGGILSSLTKGVVRTTLVALGGAVGEHLLELHKQTVAASRSGATGKAPSGGSYGNTGAAPGGSSKAVPLLEQVSDHTMVAAVNSKATLDTLGAMAPILSNIAVNTRVTADLMPQMVHALDETVGAYASAEKSRENARHEQDSLQRNILTVLKKGMGIDEYAFLKQPKNDTTGGGGDGKGLFSKIFGGTALGEIAAKLFGRGGALGFVGAMFRPLGSLIRMVGGGLTRGIGGLGKLAFKTLGPLVSLADGVVHAWQGWSDKATDKLLGSHTLSDKLQAAAINMLSGMTMGIVSPERIRDITEQMSDWVGKRVLSPIFASTQQVADGFTKALDYTKQTWLNMKQAVYEKLVIPVEKTLGWIEDKLDALAHIKDKAKLGVSHFLEDAKQGLKSDFAIGKALVTHGPRAAVAQANAEVANIAAMRERQAAEQGKLDQQYQNKVDRRDAATDKTVDSQRADLSKQQVQLGVEQAQHDKDYAADDANFDSVMTDAGHAWSGTGKSIAHGAEAVYTGANNIGAEVGAAGAGLLPGSRPSSVGQPVAAPGAAVAGDDSDKRVLDAIAAGESDSSGGYNAVFGMRGGLPSLTSMTLAQVLELQRQRTSEGVYSSAVGRYQFIHSTLQGLIRKLGLSMDEKFSPEVQDKLALSLLDEVGRQQYKAGRISAAQYQRGIASKWMSVGDPVTGRGTHDDDGVNHASARATSLVTAALTGAPSPTAMPGAAGRPSGVAGAGTVASARPAAAAAPESAGALADATASLRAQIEKMAGAATPAAPAPAAQAPGDASGFMSLDSISMLPTDSGLMAINTGMA